MSLNYELGEIEDWKTVCRKEDGSLNGITDCLIWSTIFVDLGAITAKNWKEFATRLRAWEIAMGPIRNDGQFSDPLDVKRHIGLRTNVGDKTTKQFQSKLALAVYRNATTDVERETEKASA